MLKTRVVSVLAVVQDGDLDKYQSSNSDPSPVNLDTTRADCFLDFDGL